MEETCLFLQGNRLFKEGKYELAKAKYDKVWFFTMATFLLANFGGTEYPSTHYINLILIQLPWPEAEGRNQGSY